MEAGNWDCDGVTVGRVEEISISDQGVLPKAGCGVGKRPMEWLGGSTARFDHR